MRKYRLTSTISLAAILAIALPLSLAVAAGGVGGGSSGGGGSAGGGNAGSGGAGTNGQMLTINGDANSEYALAQTAITQQDFQSAVTHLNTVLASQPDNPDALNLMGFSKRKLGDQSGALQYYDKALALQPNHVGANEYLGELYLEMKLPAKAQERLDALQQICGRCEEYTELKEKMDQYKATNG